MRHVDDKEITGRFGKNLSELLDVLGMNQCELASLCRLTAPAISQICSGKREPSLSTVVKILGVIPAKFERLIQ